MQKIFVETLGLRIVKNARIHYFHIDYNAPCLPPPKILHNRYFEFLLGITVVPREIQDNGYAKFRRANKVHYGLCAYVKLVNCKI